MFINKKLYPSQLLKHQINKLRIKVIFYTLCAEEAIVRLVDLNVQSVCYLNKISYFLERLSRYVFQV